MRKLNYKLYQMAEELSCMSSEQRLLAIVTARASLMHGIQNLPTAEIPKFSMAELTARLKRVL